jgi:hypothetical protein
VTVRFGRPLTALQLLTFTVFVSPSTHVKTLLPSCDCPSGPSPNGGHTSCVFALSYTTTWLKAQDLLCRRTTFVLSSYLVCFTCRRRRRCRPVRPDVLSTPFLLLTDSTRLVVVVFVVVGCCCSRRALQPVR